MSITTNDAGLCNQIIRNLSLSLLAKKFDLYVKYSKYNKINNQLGIKLFCGTKKYNKTIEINDNNYMNYYDNIIENDANFNFMNYYNGYFQTLEITNILHKHFKTNKKDIIMLNPYKERYNNNNDLFLHIRLGDAKQFNVGLPYYIHCIKLIKKKYKYDNIYVASDQFNHALIKKLKNLYPKIVFIDKNEVETIQFGSTCKNIILSHGSFSAMIGYLAFFSNIYYLNKNPGWCPLALFQNKDFIPINL